MQLDHQVLSLSVLNHLRTELKERGIGWLINLFLRELPNYLNELNFAVTNHDSEKLYQAAHKFKGACSNVGAVGMVELCQQLEQLGQTNNLVQATQIVQQEVVQESFRLQQALEQEKLRDQAS